MKDDILDTIKREIEKPFEEGGYKLINTHFENGKNLHSKQYYFAKRFFQNSHNCDLLARLLATKLNRLNFPESTTIIGFRNYTGLLLNKTIELLGKFNYAIIEQEQDSFTWQHLPVLQDNLVIVLPITCTCSTYIKLRKFLNDYCKKNDRQDKVNINVNFINIFLILEESLRNRESDTIMISDIKGVNNDLYRIYSAFNWTEINPNHIQFNNNTSTVYYANPIVRLYSQMYLPESCPLCFPRNEISKIVEKPLFPTHDNFETPNLIFGFPNFSEVINSNTFFEVFGFIDKVNNSHLYGHISVNQNSYLNYIRGNAFYQVNKHYILSFFNDKLTSFLDNSDTKVVFITNETRHSSNFLEDISLSLALERKVVTILRFQYSHEFIDNFISLHSSVINGPNTKVIYFTEVLSAGKTFKLLSDYIKHSRKDYPSKVGRHGFDLVLTLVDRTLQNTRDEIVKKLYSEVSKDNIDDKLISFYKLNVPVISASYLGNPLKQRLRDLAKMIEQCHLDTLKVILARQVSNQRPSVLPEIDFGYDKLGYLNYFPFKNLAEEIDEKLFQLYNHSFTKERMDLLKLYLTHEINSELAKSIYQTPYFFSPYLNNPSQFITDLISKISDRVRENLNNFFLQPHDFEPGARNLAVELEIVHDTLVKILSRHPFIYYKNIYEAVFEYCITKLDFLFNEIENRGIGPFWEFRKIKFYIRRSIQVNSNFILSERFLSCIKNHFTKEVMSSLVIQYTKGGDVIRKAYGQGQISEEYFYAAINNIKYKSRQTASFFSYLLYCYKEILFKNPYRSIKLEELLNSRALLPDEIANSNSLSSKLEELMADPYFHFTGMIKAENVYLLNELKELHKSSFNNTLGDNLGNKKELKRKIFRYYFKMKKNDPIILNALKLVEKSRHYENKTKYKEIKSAVVNMLSAVSLLENKKKKINSLQKPDKNNLDLEIKEILESVIDIIQPGLPENSLNYGFFIEFRKRKNLDTDNIYAILSNATINDSKLVRLSERGLVYNMLYGLYDNAELSNPQTMLAVAQLEDGRSISFNDEYFYKEASSKSPVGTLFQDLYNEDVFNPATGQGHKLFQNSEMSMVFRLSNFNRLSDHKYEYKLEGQAVLVISCNQKPSLNNFLDFMSNEKFRLLLLIKEELIEYLQKQFDNDAFIEVLESRRSKFYQSSLRHGLAGYTNILEYLIDEIQTSSTSIASDSYELFEIVINAMRGQLQAIETKNQEKNLQIYSADRVIKMLATLFNSDKIGKYKIPFESVLISNFNFNNLRTNKIVMDVIIPEIIINIKK